MSILTGICKNCGKKKEEHIKIAPDIYMFCEPLDYDGPTFYDSGLAALDDHKEELYEAVSWIPDHAFPMDDGKPLKGFMVVFSEDEFNKLESILNKLKQGFWSSLKDQDNHTNDQKG